MEIMEAPDKILFKTRLRQFGLSLISARIDAAKQAIDQAQESANSEEKSSAGDKYETGRAMGHLQKDMYARQLSAYTLELAALHGVHTEQLYAKPVSGAFVDCGELAFFIAAGLGKQETAGRTIFFLSPQAPLAALLSQKKAGDAFEFNKKTLYILEVY